MTLDTYGRAFVESSKRSPQLSFFARTSPLIYESASTSSARTWNAWVTTLRLACSQRGVAGRPTSENVYSGSVEEEAHLPTPTATPYGTSQNEGEVEHKRPSKGTPSLETAAKRGLLEGNLSAMPTPTAQPGTGHVRGDGKWVPTLETAAKMGALPTPQAHDAKSSPGAEARERGGFMSSLSAAVLPTPRNTRGAMCSEASESEGDRNSPGLAYVVAHALPTPQAYSKQDSNQPGLTPLDIKVRGMYGNEPLPTPTVNDSKNDGGPSQHERNTRALNALASKGALPTPRAAEAEHSGRQTIQEGHQKGLVETVISTFKERGSLPTPTAMDGKGARNATDETGWATVEAQGGKCREGEGKERHSGTTLSDVAYSTGVEHPSPSSSHEKSGKGGKLNPEFVEWMMDIPTAWTDYRVSVTRSFQSWLLGHFRCSSPS